ncbi:RNA polymerase sigma factor SigJ [Nocardia huaxiensis]|uniref:RNA polymerase sigma factor SigJ n=1 Tax=Nocardia huaxiensis TaxID=2755382 RepID=A0A7D6ZGD7_9NOCA|nr:RNA polymerase sigma factor SigJ [Nocardia huaxiensis]QLY30299.1 RNA polymerase sigma factor SigJ [Nocardia huaxiensis]UFS96069.1 RNA polymerase sigma factor SigJ [Nocardia huaxiensis]
MFAGASEADLFESSRGRLEAIAYRLLGSAADAQDAVQDTYLRWSSAERDYVESPEAWLTKVLTNICLNQLTSARARRETYVGQWLPEPVFTGDPMLGPADTVEQRESVSMAMLTVMERLSANERVVYVLREAFGYQHSEIAEILEITEANCQQIFRRAKQHMATGRTRIEVDQAAATKIVEGFLDAAINGDTETLISLLTENVISIGDGGAFVSTLSRPLVGADRVARFLRLLVRPTEKKRTNLGGAPVMFAAVVNGMPAVVITVNGRVVGLLCLEVTTDGIAAFHGQVNPGKLVRANQWWADIEHGNPLVESW